MPTLHVPDAVPSAPEPLAERRELSPLALALIVTLGGMVAFTSFGVLAQVLNIGFGLWLTEVFIFLALPFVLLRLAGKDPVRYVGLRFSGWAPVAFGFALGTANFFALVIPLQHLSLSLAPERWKEIFDATQIFKNQTRVELALILSGVSLAAPFCEEYFFRGVVQPGLKTAMRPVTALVVTALLFSAFHLDPIGLLARFELGLLFGLLYARSGSVWPAIGAHAANNVVSTVLYFAGRASERPDEEPPLWAVLAMGAAGMALLALLWQLGQTRWRRVWQTREPAANVAATIPLSLVRLLAPWAVALVVSVGLLFAIDRRGVFLNFIDARFQVSEPHDEDAWSQERERLRALRQRARRGEVPLAEYASERQALSETIRAARSARND